MHIECRLLRALRLAITATALIMMLTPGPALALTEGDWMIALVDSLGRSYGLPDQPQPDDYLRLLAGKRSFRFEAEATYGREDEVSVLSFLSYGPFSGKGWIIGTSRPTEAHLRFIVPLDGRYRLGLALNRPGHAVQIDDRRVTVDGEAARFSLADLGEVLWTAGPHEITVTLPPGGAVDYLELTAPNLPAITPPGGWRTEAPLSWETLAVTAVQALDLGAKLPATETTIAVEAETAPSTGGAMVTDEAHLGRPSGGRWLRADAQPARVDVPMNLPAAGYYEIELIVLGAPIGILINDHLSLTVTGKPYLDTVGTPPVFLPAGQNRLQFDLPPGGGLDRIALKARRSDLAALAEVLGLTPTVDPPSTAAIDQLTARLASATR